MLNEMHVRRRFDRAAQTFDDADFVHAVTRDGLMQRLAPLLVDAKTVIDLGAATGAAHRMLLKRFRSARLIAVDLSHNMLLKCRERKSWLAKASFVQARAARLPLADSSVDVVFSNLMLPSVGEPDAVFHEVSRVLRKDGVFAFSTLGPDSLQEISRAWRSVDDGGHVHPFPDMHDIGDGLVRAGLRDPVLDVDRLGVDYEQADKLFADLGAVGARNCRNDRSPGLTGKQRFRSMQEVLAAGTGDAGISLNLELVYGHCWGTGGRPDPGTHRIDASSIPIRAT